MVRTLIPLAVLACLAPGAAHATAPVNGDLVCEAPADELDAHRLLRALSLDLRGRLPTADEHAEVSAAGEVPEELLDAWLRSADFADRVVRLHQDLLWNNVEDVRLVNTRGRIRQSGGIWWRSGTQANRYRGANVRCLDEPATFDAYGAVEVTEMDDGSRREGWVELSPYWAPDTTVKVCAFDAQDAQVSPSGTVCASPAGLNDLACGCGPGLRNCLPGGATEQLITQAMALDIELRLRDIVARDASYVELFTSQTVWVNGPLVHYWRHLRAFPRMTMDPAPVDLERLPELAFTDEDTWIPVEMGPQHAGVLTSPAFLLRFQTNRARANRFYAAFLCQPFNAPSGGLPVVDEAALTEPDLQVRGGCEYCHALLEPAASHWGRWGERGASYLEPIGNPPFDPECQLCATSGLPCSSRCRTFYTVTAASPKEADYLGWLNSYLFRRPEHELFVEEGPKLLVYNTIVDGRFPTCVARTVAERLLGRAVDPDEDAWLDDVAQAFVASGYRYREAVEAVLTHPAYRRVR